MAFNTNTNTSNKRSSSTTTSTYNLQYPTAMLHAHPQPSSTPLSSISSSPHQCTPTTFYNSPSTLSFTGFETTATTSITIQNYHHQQQVNDNNTLLMFGSDDVKQAAVAAAAAASCSSSDGSCFSGINNEDQQGINNITIAKQNYDAGFNSNSQEQKPCGNGGTNGGLWGQTQSDPLLNYGLEEIKQLISTNINVGINSFNYFDESKAEETAKLMYYYWKFLGRERKSWVRVRREINVGFFFFFFSFLLMWIMMLTVKIKIKIRQKIKASSDR